MDDIKFIKSILKLEEQSVLSFMSTLLRSCNYKKVYATTSYVYAVGDLPVLLVGHADTVRTKPPQTIYFDPEEQVFMTKGVLGGDDRAAIFAMTKILEDGYRPSILICAQEEAGCIGATHFVHDFPMLESENRYMIEIDRHGFSNFVTYECANPEFDSYISSFGWEKQEGIYSDISVLAPFYKLAACNVSAGYMDEHSSDETLHLNELYKIIERIKLMLDDVKEQPVYEYIDKYKGLYTFGINAAETSVCNCCGTTVFKNNVIPMYNGADICIDCCDLDNVQFCEECGLVFYGNKDEKYCPHCRKKIKNKFKVKKKGAKK